MSNSNNHDNNGWNPPDDLPPKRRHQSQMTPEKGRIARWMDKQGYLVADIARYLDVNWGRVTEAKNGRW